MAVSLYFWVRQSKTPRKSHWNSSAHRPILARVSRGWRGGITENMEPPFQLGGWSRPALGKRDMCLEDTSWILSTGVGFPSSCESGVNSFHYCCVNVPIFSPPNSKLYFLFLLFFPRVIVPNRCSKRYLLNWMGFVFMSTMACNYTLRFSNTELRIPEISIPNFLSTSVTNVLFCKAL